MLGELVDAGKVRWIGSSTFAVWMVMEELAMARERNLPAFVSEQPPYNLLDRRIENELLPLCERYDVAVVPWSPIAGGVLSGRYDSFMTGRTLVVDGGSMIHFPHGLAQQPSP